MRRSRRKQLSIRRLFTRVYGLASGTKTRVAGTIIDASRLPDIASGSRDFSFGASSIGTGLGFIFTCGTFWIPIKSYDSYQPWLSFDFINVSMDILTNLT